MTENIQIEKDGAYDRGFLDACHLLLGFACTIQDEETIPNEGLSKLVRCLEYLYGLAVEKYEENVRTHFMILDPLRKEGEEDE